MSYMVIIREPIKGSDDYMEAEYDGCEYADRKDAEAVLRCAKDLGFEAWIEDDYIPEDFCYADTDSIKTEGPYRGGFTHTDSVKEDPMGHDNIHMYAQARTCPLCNKTFYCNVGEWAYKAAAHSGKYRYFCSWSCLQKYRKIRKEKPNAEKDTTV